MPRIKRPKNADAPVREPHPATRFVGSRSFDPKLEFEGDEGDTKPWWIKVEPARGPDEAPAALAQDSGRFIATFSWVLKEATPRQVQDSTSGGPARSASTVSLLQLSVHALQQTFASLPEEQSIIFRYQRGSAPSEPRVQLFLIGAARHKSAETACEFARELQSGLRVILSAVSTNLGFEPTMPQNPAASASAKAVTALHPATLALTSNQEIGYLRSGSQPAMARLPVPPTKSLFALHEVPLLLMELPSGSALDVTVSGLRMASADIRRLSQAREKFVAGSADLYYDLPAGRAEVSDDYQRKKATAALDMWCLQPSGYAVQCLLFGPVEYPEAILKLVGEEVFGGKPTLIGTDTHSEKSPSGVDLTSAYHASEAPPPLLPDLRILDRLGYSRLFVNPNVKLPDDGLLVGTLHSRGGAQEVRIQDQDRDRHCYIVGATGTGKSTLLRHMIAQDFRRGAGAIVLDPHGDLFQQLLESIPAHRAHDVVVLDPTDFERAASINLLDCHGPNKAIQQNFVINEFSAMFNRMYDMKVAGGPMFDQYMRFALMLLMNAPPGTTTLADLLRVFDDNAFRQRLLATCEDRFVREFWQGAEARTGEHGLHNFGGYITSKFVAFVGNPLIRPIIAQAQSTIDFRQILDSRQILLVNLSKGLLGERDSHFLGSLIVTKILAAALSRASLPKAKRRTSYLYIDEFQNFTNDTLGTVLSEARKYGLSLTIAHQHVTQIPEQLFESVMGNTAIKLFFRVGILDGGRLEPYCLPHFGKEDLSAIPDFHSICSMVSSNAPLPAFLFAASRGPHESDSAKVALAERIVARSRQRHTRTTLDVERALQSGYAAPGAQRLATVPLLGGFLGTKQSASVPAFALESDGMLKTWRANLARPRPASSAPKRGQFHWNRSGDLVFCVDAGGEGPAAVIVVRSANPQTPPGWMYQVPGQDSDPAESALAGQDLAGLAPYVIEGHDWLRDHTRTDLKWLALDPPPQWGRDDLCLGGFFRTMNSSLVFVCPESDRAETLRAVVCIGGHGQSKVLGEKPLETYAISDAGQFLVSPKVLGEIMKKAPLALGVLSGMTLAERLTVRELQSEAGVDAAGQAEAVAS